MGWQDRDYAQRAGPQRPSWVGGGGTAVGKGSIVTKLMWINAGVFVLCSITSQGNMLKSPVFEATVLHTSSVMNGQVWRLITAQYLHWDFMHILMNMIGLHFLGRSLERDWGAKKFFGVYTAAGLLGNLFYVALTLMGWLSMNGIAAGASGCVLGLLGVCAVRYPHAQVLIYFMFPIKIRTAALVFGAWYVLNLYTRGSNAGGDACHVAGLLFGAWWAYRGEVWWSRSGTRLKVPRPRRAERSSFKRKVEQRRNDAETVDRILKKVYDSGVHSLSESEKRALQEATQRRRERE